MARAKVDVKAAKEKRQKVILAVGGVLLLGLLAIQGPKLLKQLEGSSPAATPAAAATATGTTTTTTSAAGSPSASVQLVALQDTDRKQPASVEKLGSLTRFHAKDPFKQQATDTATAGSSGPAAPAVPAAPSPKAKAAAKQASAGAGPVFGTVEAGGARAPKGELVVAGLPQATLRVNGKKALVPLGQSFPKSSPVFRLAGFAPGTVKIAVVAGSLADGSQLLTLHRRHSITLVNTVNGARYKLELLSTSRTAS